MNSCLYECTVMHLRTKPKKHRLLHKIFMFYLDLDEVDAICKNNFLIGHNRWRPYGFYDQDHLPLGKKTVRENVVDFLRSKGIMDEVGRVMLLVNLRTFGYVFNPLSVYFCFDKNDRPLCSVPEIGNTFGEIKAFILSPDTLKDNSFKDEQKKFYYISPFSKLDISLDFNFKIPADRLDIRVDDISNGEKILYASLTGKQKALSVGNLLWMTLRYPLVTLKVIALIHLHALWLYFRKMPFYTKQDNPHFQKEVLRAWNKN
jgi:DUF1365 family protein